MGLANAQEFERRVIHTEVRAVSDSNGLSITGRGVVYNKLSADLGGFRERVKPGAFTNVLRSNPDVMCLFNHNPSAILGRTKSGTMMLQDRADGLYFTTQLPNTQAARDLHESIKRGDINGCSFGFNVRGGEDVDWSEEQDPEDRSRFTCRTLRNIPMLHDIGPVTCPAYPVGTNVDARSLGAIVLAKPPVNLKRHKPDVYYENELHVELRRRRRELLNVILGF